MLSCKLQLDAEWLKIEPLQSHCKWKATDCTMEQLRFYDGLFSLMSALCDSLNSDCLCMSPGWFQSPSSYLTKHADLLAESKSNRIFQLVRVKFCVLLLLLLFSNIMKLWGYGFVVISTAASQHGWVPSRYCGSLPPFMHLGLGQSVILNCFL